MGLSLAALAVALSGGAYALGKGSSSTIVACVHHKGGGLYVARRCARHDKRLSWSVSGPPGAKGPTGLQGAQGPATGPAGGDLTGSYPNPRLAPGAIVPTASNANELGGQPPSTYVQQCQNGAIWGRAEITVSSVSASEFAASGVRLPYVCDSSLYGAQVLAERPATGFVNIVFGNNVINGTMGLGSGLTGPLAQATSENAKDVVSVAGPFNCGSNPFHTCYQAQLEELNGTATNAGSFAIQLG
jgi:hypothetical protein